MKSKFNYVFLGVVMVLVLTIASIVKYNTMLSKKSLYAIAGTQENYSWAVAKFIMQLSEFYALIKTNGDDLDNIKLKLDIIYSRVNAIRDRSESTTPLYNQKGYKETIDSIFEKINKIDYYINLPKPNLVKVEELVDKMSPDSKLLANIADHAEVLQRNTAYQDFFKIRDQLWYLLSITIVLASVMGIMVLFQLFKLNKLLDSEKKAFNNKNAFLGIVSHELRTSLQAIVASIDVLSHSKSNNNVKKHQVDRLENTVLQMERQIKDLTEFAKVDNGNVEINNACFNLKELVDNTVEGCLMVTSKKDLEVKIDTVSNVNVIGDKFRMSQIIENILTNAIKYTMEGTINISVSFHSGNSLMITVKDSGIGIPKNKIKNIFNPFIRLNNAYNNTPGFGMGLAIVHGVVKAMKGTINVTSEVGRGSEFVVKIPMTVSEEVPTEPVIDETDAQPKHKGINILVVDDNELLCKSISLLLDSSDYHTEYTTSPERALEKLLRKPYDIVLSDLQMPVMTGDELYTKLIESEGPNKNSPFVFISAFTNQSPIKSVPILMKPVRIQDLNRMINSLIG